MKDKRPVNLDISTITLPITAYASILHRVTGVILFGAAGVLLWMLDMSLASQDSFDALKVIFTHPVSKLVLWGILAALAYHLLAGVRHLLMDMGFGETLNGGVLGAKILLIAAGIVIFLAGAWVWL